MASPRQEQKDNKITDEQLKEMQEKLAESNARRAEAEAELKKQKTKVKKMAAERDEQDKLNSDRQRKMLGFQINQQDRDEWISASPFKNQIQQVQTVINRLDSFLIWNGRAKAQAIRDALNRAIDAAIQYEACATEIKRFKDFSEFAKFSKSKHSGLYAHFDEPSLENALSIHRFADIDVLFEKDEPESHSIISKKS